MASDRFWTTRFAHLRYGIVWIGYAVMRGLVLLPFGWQLALGRGLGLLAYRLLPPRRRVAARNLELCFPDLSEVERNAILKEHFASLGASLVEMSMGWFGSARAVRSRIRVAGTEHLRAAMASGRGVLLFGAHFTTIEFFWPALRDLCPKLSGMYRAAFNPAMTEIMRLGRGRYIDTMVTKDNVRQLIRCLRNRSVVWYASDQSHTGKGSAWLHFFGQPALTNTAVSRIAKATDSVVLPYSCRRIDSRHYEMRIDPPLPGVPSDDEIEDTERLTRLLEERIREYPAQYWWIHKRFKGRDPDVYARTTGTRDTS